MCRTRWPLCVPRPLFAGSAKVFESTGVGSRAVCLAARGARRTFRTSSGNSVWSTHFGVRPGSTASCRSWPSRSRDPWWRGTGAATLSAVAVLEEISEEPRRTALPRLISLSSRRLGPKFSSGWSCLAMAGGSWSTRCLGGRRGAEKRDTSLGAVLTDVKGMTLYTFSKDDAGNSNCYGI